MTRGCRVITPNFQLANPKLLGVEVDTTFTPSPSSRTVGSWELEVITAQNLTAYLNEIPLPGPSIPQLTPR